MKRYFRISEKNSWQSRYVLWGIT